MNIAKAFTLAVLLVLSTIGLAGNSARAVTLNIDGHGQLLGADDVNVGGFLYDVLFVEGSCVSLFSGCDEESDFAFTTQADAFIAGVALMDQVFTDSASGSFDLNPELTFGCSNLLECTAIIPYAYSPIFSPSNPLLAVLAANHSAEFKDTGTGFTNTDPTTNSLTTHPDAQVYAQFTAVSVVPLPPSAILFGTALLGLAGIRRRKRKAA